jgi:hypothetical protein
MAIYGRKNSFNLLAKFLMSLAVLPVQSALAGVASSKLCAGPMPAAHKNPNTPPKTKHHESKSPSVLDAHTITPHSRHSVESLPSVPSSQTYIEATGTNSRSSSRRTSITTSPIFFSTSPFTQETPASASVTHPITPLTLSPATTPHTPQVLPVSPLSEAALEHHPPSQPISSLSTTETVFRPKPVRFNPEASLKTARPPAPNRLLVSLETLDELKDFLHHEQLQGKIRTSTIDILNLELNFDPICLSVEDWIRIGGLNKVKTVVISGMQLNKKGAEPLTESMRKWNPKWNVKDLILVRPLLSNSSQGTLQLAASDRGITVRFPLSFR